MRSTALVERSRFAADAVPPQRSTRARTEPGGDDRVEVASVDYLTIFTPELRRSVRFYARVFGFRLLEATRRGAGLYALLSAGQLYLSIRERPAGGSDPARALCWSFVVDDVERARASIWNLGIVPVSESTDGPQGERLRRRRRSFVIRDPGGNEIEIVERARR
jgi:catechol 2,3-dioxygenase-like lactoylglutathione lyase family enzyme